MWPISYWFSSRLTISITFAFTNNHSPHQRFVKIFVKQFVSLAYSRINIFCKIVCISSIILSVLIFQLVIIHDVIHTRKGFFFCQIWRCVMLCEERSRLQRLLMSIGLITIFLAALGMLLIMSSFLVLIITSLNYMRSRQPKP